MKVLIISSSISSNSKSFELCSFIKQDFEKKLNIVDLIDARDLDLKPYHYDLTDSMKKLSIKIKHADSIIIGMGVHCYSINDSLKIILDNCFEHAIGKFFGILCAAGGERSYLSTMHLTQICMNEWRMIQLPRIVYASKKDFNKQGPIDSEDLIKRLKLFSKEYISIGNRLIF